VQTLQASPHHQTEEMFLSIRNPQMQAPPDDPPIIQLPFLLGKLPYATNDSVDLLLLDANPSGNYLRRMSA
jgi:hypothetical protein